MSMSPPPGGRRFAAQGEINVTPLIDIVLVLLIVFMVMTPVTLKELVAKIPERAADSSPQPPGDNPIIVELRADETITVGGQPVTPDALAERVAERLRHDRKKVVFFRVDDRASYGRAVKIMDLCKGAGAATLAIVTANIDEAATPATPRAR
jgi:biopolymer transport protein TolR